MTETAINILDNDCRVWSDQMRFKNRIHELAKKYPNDVKIIIEPEDNDGNIGAVIPKEWIKILPPRASRELTDEEREEMRNRLALARQKSKSKTSEEGDED